MELEQIEKLLADFTNGQLWIIYIFLIVFSAAILDFFQKRLTKKLHKKFDKTNNVWDDALLHAVRLPLSLVIWMVGLSFAMSIAGLGFAPTFREAAVVISITWFTIRLIKFVEKNILYQGKIKGAQIDRTTADAVAQLLRLTTIITGALVLLQTLGFNISAILAFGGIGGIAVGFAAKDLLSNFFGGMMIYLDRPFAVGDWVRSPDRQVEGTVEKIGWRLTVIRTFDKRPLYVPNSIFATIAVENPSRMKNRRIYETIGIRYDDADKLPAIVANVKEMLLEHDEIDTTQTLIVNFNSFAPSSLDFFIYTFTKTTDWIHFHEVKQDVLFKVNEIISSHNAEMAFPTSTIHLQKGV